ncbi:twin-arginine translocation signal domain-containing protein [Streptomyces sp. NPDC006631]
MPLPTRYAFATAITHFRWPAIAGGRALPGATGRDVVAVSLGRCWHGLRGDSIGRRANGWCRPGPGPGSGGRSSESSDAHVLPAADLAAVDALHRARAAACDCPRTADPDGDGLAAASRRTFLRGAGVLGAGAAAASPRPSLRRCGTPAGRGPRRGPLPRLT